MALCAGPGEGSVSRLGDVRRNADRGQFLGDVTPAHFDYDLGMGDQVVIPILASRLRGIRLLTP
jgi:hypothetical protein